MAASVDAVRAAFGGRATAGVAGRGGLAEEHGLTPPYEVHIQRTCFDLLLQLLLLQLSRLGPWS